MTTGKPPQPPLKTQLGLPDDVQAALQKVHAQRQQPGGSNPAPAPDLQRTLYGNPHAAPAGAGSARPASSAQPPKLPPSQPFQPPPLPARSQPAPPAHVQSPAGMNRTQYGGPADLDAAARQARAMVAAGAAAAPQSQRPAPQPAQRPGLGAQPPSAASPAPHAAVHPGQTVMLKDAPQLSAAVSARPAEQAVPAASAGVSAHPSVRPALPQQPSQLAAGTGVASAAAAAGQPAASIPAGAAAKRGTAEFVATEPDRERPSNRPEAAAGVPSLRLPAQPSLNLPQNPMQATRLVSFEAGALPPLSTANGAPSPLSATPQLSLNPDDVTARKPPPVRRWPALSLLGIGAIAFGGVVVVRAPGSLPAPLVPYAMLVAREVEALIPSPEAPQPAAAASQPEPVLAADPNANPASAAQPELAPPSAAADQQGAPGNAQPPPSTAQAAGTQPQAVAAQPAPAQAQSPTPQPSAAQAPATIEVSAALPAATVAAPPAALQGATAELEKQAIDLVLANDYPAARAVYERLRAVEPTRPEYGVMLELLMREIAPACGGPGQVPCAQP